MSRYMPYLKYEAQDIEGLEVLPSNWEVKQVRYILKDGAEGIKIGPFGSALKLEDMVEKGFRVYGQENVIKKDFTLGKRKISDIKFREMEVYKIFPQDILITMMGTSGKCAIVPDDVSEGIIDSHLLRVRVKPEYIRPEFFKLLIDESPEIAYQIKIQGKGSIMHGLNSGIVKSLFLPVPSTEEQDFILSFLDHETAKIDTLIDKQLQLIKLLIEKRQAVISHTVTKGLNPDAPMKDSGVEWLGEVPDHWRVCRLKHIATIQSGIAKGGKDLSGKTLISAPMLRVANVQDGYLKLEDVHSIQIEPKMLERYSLKYGDVLMNEGGDNDKLGRGAIWREQVQNCIHQNHVFSIRTQGIEPEWLDTLTRASYAKFYFFSVAKQSTNLASISATNIKETPILVPPEEERKEILLHLDHQLARFDALENKCESQISLLKERRTTLISATVTGKIDVRNWQATASQEAQQQEAS
ncbi:type I restriction enzyme, S subunit [Vibrio crassostreae]|uniref:restriction endonuclease subunit S n=1 Tax=Vibrio crassostreae TaxID=246167 RepID=UPI0005DB1064|nr:restriction endonuclease subunit S [Vibrio crassostreae]TCT64290.1 type I restriction enzyme S subunit [Vibrio crassostreae]TCT84526.1 type I restriction enzyme S subunit [Vibrio crassostreae]TCU05811.1 type I restriction enzyme S subunit [Vibrio crassostreae]TDW12978.1 type I restriction enzyme S subunit [Vibrio crassostreae]CAK1847875.1 type I restriction enzyme, S subunit [Vibrio crassostreae]